MANTVSIAILADARKAVGGFEDAGKAAEKAGSKFDGVASASDGVASASSQAAGGIGDLGGALSLMPGPLGAVGTGMEALSPAIMGVTGAADLLNLATEKFPGFAKVASAASKTMATAQRVLGAAIRFAMGPWGIALAAITVAIVLLWKKNEGFRNAIIKVWNKIKAGVGKVIGWFKGGGFLGFLKALPGRIIGFVRSLPGRYVAIYRRAFTLAFTVAKSLGGKVVDTVKAIPGKLLSVGGKMLSAGKTLIGKFFQGLAKLGDLAVNLGHDLINGVIRGINAGISAINNIIPDKIAIKGLPDINLPNDPFPKIQYLANGGILNGPTFVAGEAGREVVAPLDELYRELGGRSNVYSIVVNAGPTTDRVALGRELVRVIDEYERAGGRRRA